MNVNTRMLSSTIMIGLLLAIGTLYVSVPIANGDDIVEEETITPIQSPGEMYFVGPDQGWTVNQDGTIEWFDDPIESYEPIETTESVNDVYFVGPDQGWTVNQDGTIEWFD